MSTYGSAPPLRSKDKHATGSFFDARTEALRRYSIKHYGVKEVHANCTSQTHAEPKCMFRLLARPDHSNYPECANCKERRMAVEALIMSSAPRAE
eukprot:1345156-Pleurochrysis_carterae.AAC.1